jgi:hypothetical protein
MPIATYSLDTMGSIKQKDTFNATTGLVWMLTSLPILKLATEVNFAAQMTAPHPLYCKAFLSDLLSTLTLKKIVFKTIYIFLQ